MKKYLPQLGILAAWIVFCVFVYSRASAQIFYSSTNNYGTGGTPAQTPTQTPTQTPSSTPTPIPTYYIDDSTTGCGGSGCSNSNDGRSLATAWQTLANLSAVPLTTGQATCLVGKATPNKTNGGIWRLTGPQAVVANGTGWGLPLQATVTSCDITKPAIITGAKCYGAASGYCVGETPITWHKCTSADALCNNSTDPNITNVYEYTRPNVVTGSVYVDDPDVITGTTLWTDQTKYLNSANCLPGAGCTRTLNGHPNIGMFQGEMTAGTWYDDGTHMYIWMVANADPSAHTIEAVVNSVQNGLLHNIGNSGGTTNQYVYFSYLKGIYYSDYGISTNANSTTAPIHVWYDHNLFGGQGQGPVPNEDGDHYASALYLKGSTGSINTPSDPVTASEYRVTNNTTNWCGSHNCIGEDSSNGLTVYNANIVGAAEHHQLDLKCVGNAQILGNYLFGAYDGPQPGTDGTQGHNGIFYENDWAGCTGGQILVQNNTISNGQLGFRCNQDGNTSGLTGDTVSCQVFNNTFALHYTRAGTTGICYQAGVANGRGMIANFQNNICYADVSGTEGIRINSHTGTPLQETITEKYNLLQNSTSNLGKVNYHASIYTSLPAWQAVAACQGTCGSNDIWGTDPLFVSLTPSSNLLPLCSNSPAVGTGTSLVGTSTTLGSDPTTQSCGGPLATRYIDNSSTGCGPGIGGAGPPCSDSNDGTTLAKAWATLNQANITALSPGTTVYLVGQTSPSTTNGGIWREQLSPNTNTTGTAWGPSTQITFTAYDQTKLPIISAAECYGAASGYCTGSTPVTWTKCTSGASACHSSTDPNIGNVYYYARPDAVTGPIYVDDPDVINTSNIWADPSHFLQIANCLPGGGCSITSPAPNANRDPFQGPMTEGTSWDDGTRLYVWLVGGANPTSHIIEAPTNTTGNGLIKSAVTAGHRDWIVYSYLKGMYSAAAGFTSNLNSTTDGIHVKFDHDQVGGTGQGPVTNGAGTPAGLHYDQAIFIKGSSNASVGSPTLPIQLVPGSEAWETNNTLNNCGSHNCTGVDGQRGAIYVENNVIGTAEHSQQDIKCAYNAIVSGNYMHDAWAGPWQTGATDANNNNSLYNEIDWDSCSGGTVLYQNNTVVGANGAGASSQVNTADTGLVQNVDFYNNTITLNSNIVQRAGMNPFANPGNTINWDAQNNIIQSRLSNDFGYQQASAGGTYNLTEDYNIYYNPTGTNTNRLGGVNYTTLAGWQGTGHGTHDIWQTDPRIAQVVGTAYELWDDSPTIGAGTGSVGTSTTMGSTPLIFGHELCPAASTCPGHSDDIQAAVLANPTVTNFFLDAGAYHIPRVIAPTAGENFYGQNSDGTYPTSTATAVPSAPPPAAILGTTKLTGGSFTSKVISGRTLYYNVIGSSVALNAAGGLNATCNLPVTTTAVSTAATNQIFWTSSTSKALNALITDSNGNTEKVTTAGTTGATAPAAWATSLNGTTTDGTVTWTLTAFNADAGWPTVAPATPIGVGACSYPQDLWFASSETDTRTWVPKHHSLKWNGGNIGPNSYFIDFESKGGQGKWTLWVNDNPASFTVELVSRQQGVLTSANTVLLDNLTIAGYGPLAQRGSIEMDGQHDSAIGNWVSNSHSEGFKPTTAGGGAPQYAVINYNEITRQGQSGLNTGGAINTTATYNQIEQNNVNGVSYGSEAGATKFAADSQGDIVSHNLIQNNNGMALWADTATAGSTWDSNTILGNLIEGIRFEISGAASAPSVITNNVVTNDGRMNNSICVANHIPLLNGVDCCTGSGTGTCGTACLTGTNKAFGEIDVTDGQYVTVGGVGNGNTVTSTCAGLRTYADTRSAANPVQSVVQSYNNVTMHTNSAAPNSPIGWQANAAFNIFTASPANSFDHNIYLWDNTAAAHAASYAAQSAPYGSTNTTTNGSWAAWQASGQDTHGTCTGTVGGAC